MTDHHPTTTADALTGVVEAVDHHSGFVKVVCADAPERLRVLHISEARAGAAVVGDRVRLRYQPSAVVGYWAVTAILRCDCQGESRCFLCFDLR